jgi:hypothetical protein
MARSLQVGDPMERVVDTMPNFIVSSHPIPPLYFPKDESRFLGLAKVSLPSNLPTATSAERSGDRVP